MLELSKIKHLKIISDLSSLFLLGSELSRSNSLAKIGNWTRDISYSVKLLSQLIYVELLSCLIVLYSTVLKTLNSIKVSQGNNVVQTKIQNKKAKTRWVHYNSIFYLVILEWNTPKCCFYTVICFTHNPKINI